MCSLPIVAFLALASASPPSELPRFETTGQVLDVRKKFCELSLGWEDGVFEGDVVKLYHGRSFLGRAVIRKTQSDRSVAEIITGFRTPNVRIGDQVRTRWYIE